VHVCSTRPSIAGASRFSQAEHLVPDALVRPEGFRRTVARLLHAERIDTLIPVSEAAIISLLPHRRDWPAVMLPFPSLDSFRRISDKAAVHQAAREVGISTPRQEVLTEPGVAHRINPDLFPVVIKPSRSVIEGDGGRLRKTGVTYAADQEELDRRLQETDPSAFPLLLQQRIVGPGIGIFLLLWNGEVHAQFAHRRLREKPPSGGVSVYRESVAADPALVEKSRRLLCAHAWRGVAMIEYKMDAASGTPYLMEVNGRFWGSLQLAIDAGVDFPNRLLEAATDQPNRPQPLTRAGIRSRWWWGDVDHLLAMWTKSRARLALPPEAPGRWRAAAEFLKLWRPGDRSEVFRFKDLAPFFRETLQWFAALRHPKPPGIASALPPSGSRNEATP
jgi:predicted ATP-grasp superfamily ATP-dependent carboligase